MQNDQDLKLDRYEYQLPESRIAQNPADPRDHSRLLVASSPTEHRHARFDSLPQWLKAGDLLVLNDTSVIPARLYGCKTTGAAVEVLLLEARSPQEWLALVRPGKRLPVGSVIEFRPSESHPDAPNLNAGSDPASAAPSSPSTADPLTATITDTDTETGGRWLKFHLPDDVHLLSVLDQWGNMPLPPYITESDAPPDRYQTIYASAAGSAAAPTAGLHFTPQLFDALAAAGIDHVKLTLHVGVGTFRPVESETITDHEMHHEWTEVPTEVVEKVQATRNRGGRVIAVGTTAVRALESAGQASLGEDKPLAPFCGKTNLFIYPGYRWQVVDGLITNFHLPRSSLMMLVAALIGRDRLLELYQLALDAPPSVGDRPYRFYSFGDAMLILPTAKLP
ncbi:MAG: tRNA preQ1(34) S-adenosylmethionine ribosyltransferase-isomerase QueA [Cyanobacteria bacterium P01_C01_bin.89]